MVPNWERSMSGLVTLFNLYAEHIMRNARLDEAQVGIKTIGRNINNFDISDMQITSPLGQKAKKN